MSTPIEAGSGRTLRWRGLVYSGSVIVLVAIATVAWGGLFRGPTPAADIMLLYVGAEDCAPCRAWQNGDGASFLASPDSRRIRYREVKSPHLTDVLNDDNWPQELRIYRNQLRRSDGVPLWMIVSGDEVIERNFGIEAWRKTVLPTIKTLLRSAPI